MPEGFELPLSLHELIVSFSHFKLAAMVYPRQNQE